MARKRRSARFVSGAIGGVVVVLSIILSIYALNSSAGLPGVPRTVVTMKFTDTGDLPVDSDLREADFRVGRINAVEYLGDGVGTVEAQFDDERPVYRNATAQIVSRSGLGQKYVNISRGTPEAGLLGSEDIIPVEQTQSTAEILELADLFDDQTVGSAQRAVEQLGSGLAGNGDALSQAVDSVPINLPRVERVANALNANGGDDVNGLLTSLSNLSSRFEGRQQQLTDLNRQLAVTLDALNVDQGQALGNLLEVAPSALPDVRRALNDINAPLQSTRAALVNLRPGVRDLARATPDVRGVLREAPTPLNKIPGVSEVGQPALQALTPALRDLRPVVPQLRFGLEQARVPLRCLAVFDVGQFFTRFAHILRQGDDTGNTARFTLIPASGTLGAAGPLEPILEAALPPETAVERACPKPTGREFATDDVQPQVQPDRAGTPYSPAAYQNGGDR